MHHLAAGVPIAGRPTLVVEPDDGTLFLTVDEKPARIATSEIGAD